MLATSDLQALSRQMADRCEHGQPVRVGYKDNPSADGDVPCTKPVPTLPQPLIFKGFADVSAAAEASSRASPTIAR